MKDIGGIDPQLKSIAKKIPYNRLMIKLAKPYQTLALKGTKLLEGVACRRISLKENGRNLPVDIYEPAAATEQLPCLARSVIRHRLIIKSWPAFMRRRFAAGKHRYCLVMEKTGSSVAIEGFYRIMED